MLRSGFVGSALLTLLLSACANGVANDLPSAPTVRMTRLTITPPGGASIIAGTSVEILTSGTTLGLGAIAEYSDSSIRYVDATWTSSDTNVIAFSGTTMHGVSRGTATVTARAQGMSDTETFIVEPDVAGSWSGYYVVDQCSASSGSMSELICSSDPARRGLLPVGASVPVTFEVMKNGSDVSATTVLGELRGFLRGTDLGGNYFSLTGDLDGTRTRAAILEWNSHVSTHAMDAAFALQLRMENIPGFANVVAHLDQDTRR
jgi:hypothetical protein